MADHSRLEKALKHVLKELNNSILERRAFNELVKLKSAHGLDFFRICSAALQNDLYAGVHRALDKHQDSVSFWYIRNIDGIRLKESARRAGVSMDDIERIADKIKPIRDQVHFHVDRRTLGDANRPWKTAGITGNEIIWLMDSAHEVLRLALLDLTGEDRPVPEYHGEDIEKIMRAYKDEYPDAPLSI